eukprot:COSAG01_NODE_773_length_13704_cov_9.386843_13_plen_79_part_00
MSTLSPDERAKFRGIVPRCYKYTGSGDESPVLGDRLLHFFTCKQAQDGAEEDSAASPHCRPALPRSSLRAATFISRTN